MSTFEDLDYLFVDSPIDVVGAIEALQAADLPPTAGALAVRALLRRLRGITLEHAETEHLRDAVVEPYKQKLQRLDDEEAKIRSSLTAYLRTTKTGKVAIPDAGTAYLAARKPKVEIDDEEKLLQWWTRDAGREVPMRSPTTDMGAIKARILAELEETGEVPPDGAGVTIVPGEKQVSVRLA
jgi:hypothetical protein